MIFLLQFEHIFFPGLGISSYFSHIPCHNICIWSRTLFYHWSLDRICWLYSSCKNSGLTSKFVLLISNLSNILCLYDATCMSFINLKRIDSSSVVMSFLPSFSNSQYLRVFLNLCTYCIIDSFGFCLVSINLVLSARTFFLFYLFIYFWSYISLNYSNNLFRNEFS